MINETLNVQTAEGIGAFALQSIFVTFCTVVGGFAGGAIGSLIDAKIVIYFTGAGAAIGFIVGLFLEIAGLGV